MAIAQEIYLLIKPAVEIIMAELNGAPDASTMEERVHARIWPYVTHAVKELRPSDAALAPKLDARTKRWEYIVRFWNITPIGENLIAETDPEIMNGTGNVPDVLYQYAAEMHDGVTPEALSPAKVKDLLPQLRNNLGRQGSAVLRIPYDIGDESYLCQIEIKSLEA